jgi:hypothetical protein
MHSHHERDALALLRKPWPPSAPPFTVLYRAEAIAALGDPAAALDFLIEQRAQVDDEAYWTVRLHCLALIGATQTLRNEFTAVLLDQPLTQPRLKMMCAQLIRHPDPTLFNRVYEAVERAHMPFNDETAGGWFSLLCTAGAVGDQTRLHSLTLRLRDQTQSAFNALLAVEAFFRDRVPEATPTSFLPVLPVPLEIAYALIERYPGRTGPAIGVSMQ